MISGVMGCLLGGKRVSEPSIFDIISDVEASARVYRKVFKCSEKEARKLAQSTKYQLELIAAHAMGIYSDPLYKIPKAKLNTKEKTMSKKKSGKGGRKCHKNIN